MDILGQRYLFFRSMNFGFIDRQLVASPYGNPYNSDNDTCSAALRRGRLHSYFRWRSSKPTNSYSDFYTDHQYWSTSNCYKEANCKFAKDFSGCKWKHAYSYPNPNTITRETLQAILKAIYQLIRRCQWKATALFYPMQQIRAGDEADSEDAPLRYATAGGGITVAYANIIPPAVGSMSMTGFSDQNYIYFMDAVDKRMESANALSVDIYYWPVDSLPHVLWGMDNNGAAGSEMYLRVSGSSITYMTCGNQLIMPLQAGQLQLNQWNRITVGWGNGLKNIILNGTLEVKRIIFCSIRALHIVISWVVGLFLRFRRKLQRDIWMVILFISCRLWYIWAKTLLRHLF